MITLLIIFIFIAVVASTWWFGIWNSLLTLINLILSGLIASSFYENVGDQLIANGMGDLKALISFVSVWLVFVVSFFVLRLVTDMTSTKKLKFDKTIEIVGQSALSVWIACVFTAFVCFTLHLSPLPPTAFQSDPSASTLGIGPDRMWLAFIQSRSRGALSSSKAKNLLAKEYTGPEHPDDAELDARVFDPDGSFIPNHIERREQLSKRKTLVR